jgi:hypothetical protein
MTEKGEEVHCYVESCMSDVERETSHIQNPVYSIKYLYELTINTPVFHDTRKGKAIEL